MWYNIAAPELCQLKADSFPRSRTLTLAGYTALLPKKRKQHVVEEDDDMELEGELEIGADVEEQYGVAGAEARMQYTR
jgi:hypothetical protein